MIETDGATRKSSTGKCENIEEEEGECGPQKDRGVVTTNGPGEAPTTFPKDRERALTDTQGMYMGG